MKQLHYKGYTSEIDISVEDNVLHGKLIGISDLVTFEALTVEELKKEFEEAVDDYIKIVDSCVWCHKNPTMGNNIHICKNCFDNYNM